MTKENFAWALIRIGVAFSFIYAAIAGFVEPDAWIGYFPPFAQNIFTNSNLLLDIFGVVQIVIALWILSNKKIFLPSLAATFLLLGIIVFNWGAMDIMFRDVSIMFAALALVVYTYSHENSRNH